MSTHNIGFYEKMSKLSFNYHPIFPLSCRLLQEGGSCQLLPIESNSSLISLTFYLNVTKIFQFTFNLAEIRETWEKGIEKLDYGF